MGRRIHKGSKARGFKEGQALFLLIDTYEPRDRWQSVSYHLTGEEIGPWSDMPH